ncbi:MATE family efflux transporter [Thiomicrospira cyclica]|jgi:MATE family multidrug resistance protein|uniref:Multidrug-efflux transporter n=1 Tax=Thiomicrospira cyclica (strain DSM 14477 / JCM 11371 / ALM1) TaxID=717773 RepID=F6DCI7_THICA|nr:MATE family efflux transporter [Thiomicrospira cyclica]AEG31573.1 MATE efflux family protein [Thiomicrospira cyclica ALM1]
MNTTSYWFEVRSILRLAWPILIAQLALTGLGVVDTLMSGWVGVEDLAAIGLGTSILLPVFMFATGILLALTPLTAKALGANQPDRIASQLHQGLWIAIPIGWVCALILWFPHPLLNLLQLDSRVYELTVGYLFWAAFGLPGVALYQVYRFYWEGLGKTLPTLGFSLAALLFNIPLNALFIFGWGPIVGMGAVGAGVATAIVMWSMLIGALIYVRVHPAFAAYRLNSILRPRWQQGIKPILWLGVPMAFALLFEVGMFTFIVFFIAPLGTVIIGAHQIAISFTSLLFMFPLSFAMALTIRVGYAYGQQDLRLLKVLLRVGLMSAMVLGILLSIFTLASSSFIVRAYTQNTEVMSIALTLFIFAAAYQIFDAIQVTAAGALRGLQDTQVTMWVTLLSYWIIGLGLGYWLAFSSFWFEPMGVYGFWIGIVIGLLLAAILLYWRLRWLSRRIMY